MKSFLVCICATLLSTGFSYTVHAQSKHAGAEVSAIVKNVFTNVRAGNAAKVFQYVDLDIVSRSLLGDYYYLQATDAQRKEFASLLQSLYTRLAFANAAEKYKNLASVTYNQPEIEGDKATVFSLAVINHPLKKQELKLQYYLAKTKKGWRVVDAGLLGTSIIQTIRDEHVKPALQNGSLDALLRAMRDRNSNP